MGIKNHGRAGVAAAWMEHKGMVLDIGCAAGMFSLLSRESGVTGVGVDISLGSLRQAKKESPGFEFALASADHLPWPDQTFDTILMLDVLEHVPYEQEALAEVDRVLRPGGKFIISVPNKGEFNRVDAQNSLLFAMGRKAMGRPGQHTLHRHYSIDELRALMPSSFRLSRVRYGGLLLFPLCGYVTMLTDNIRMHFFSSFVRSVEQVDFDRDFGQKSWHLMAEFIKDG
jgi:SAM-dependent methyltransferase